MSEAAPTAGWRVIDPDTAALLAALLAAVPPPGAPKGAGPAPRAAPLADLVRALRENRVAVWEVCP